MRNFHLPGRSPVLASNGMVATSHPLAASEALGILKSGGNAADAAIAGAVLLGLCEPQMTGIGGDCFALVKPAGSEKVHALNGSGRAPAGLDADALRKEGITKIEPGHPASITLPGAVDGFCELSNKYGRIGLDRILAPAIHYFEEGAPVAPRVAFDIEPFGKTLNSHARRHFMNRDRPHTTGETLRLPGQAQVLRRLAKQGRSAFYEDEVAEDMLATLAEIGGTHAAEDFANVSSDWGEPLSGPYRGHDLLEHPPNGQGATAILIARMLEHFDIGAMHPNSAERIHLKAEATKLAYDARNRFLADPDHTTDLAHMIAPETAEKLASLIDPNRALPILTPLAEDVHKDTVLITVVDKDGMAVSLIYSIFATFGSCIASDKFGILFHNRGSGFNLTSGHVNEAGGGKRPMHTIIPAMRRTAGKIDMAFGVMGGQYQATGHAQLMSNVTDFGMDIQEAIDAPRAFADPISGNLNVENTIPEAVLSALAEKGHRIHVSDTPIGGAQAILMDHQNGTLIGGSDPRKDGLAIGC